MAPLAPDWVAVTGSTFDGAFKSTCTISGSIADTEGGSPISFFLNPADGGRWAGVALGQSQQMKATITWEDCENTDGTGQWVSSTFSGGDGDLFVLHYGGVDAEFDWMVQGTDRLGGQVHVQFASDADPADVASLIDGIGLSSAPDVDDPTFVWLSWTDTKNVASVLYDLSATELYAWGEPTWVEKPAWW